jgi:hypothetical protein
MRNFADLSFVPGQLLCGTQSGVRLQMAMQLSMEQPTEAQAKIERPKRGGHGMSDTSAGCSRVIDGAAPTGCSRQSTKDADWRGRSQAAPEGLNATEAKRRKAEGVQAGRKRKLRLTMTEDDVESVFQFIGEGKVTIGQGDFVGVVNTLGLDVDDTMVEAAFEVVRESGLAGPCNRLDLRGLQLFVQQLQQM